MKVQAIMSEDPVTVEADATLREACRAMTQSRVGSVLVVGEGLGILTETDVVRAGAELDVPFSTVEVTRVATPQPVTISPSASVEKAVRTMIDEEVKRLPVREGIDLVGMVTVTDVSAHLPDRVSEVRSVARERREWTV